MCQIRPAVGPADDELRPAGAQRRGSGELVGLHAGELVTAVHHTLKDACADEAPSLSFEVDSTRAPHVERQAWTPWR